MVLCTVLVAWIGACGEDVRPEQPADTSAIGGAVETAQPDLSLPERPGASGLVEHFQAALDAVARRPALAQEIVRRWRPSAEQHRKILGRPCPAADAEGLLIEHVGHSLLNMKDHQKGRVVRAWQVDTQSLPTASPDHAVVYGFSQVPAYVVSFAKAGAPSAGRVPDLWAHVDGHWKVLLGVASFIRELVHERVGDDCRDALKSKCISARYGPDCVASTHRIARSVATDDDAAIKAACLRL